MVRLRTFAVWPASRVMIHDRIGKDRVLIEKAKVKNIDDTPGLVIQVRHPLGDEQKELESDIAVVVGGWFRKQLSV